MSSREPVDPGLLQRSSSTRKEDIRCRISPNWPPRNPFSRTSLRTIFNGVLAWNRAANAKNFLRSLYFMLSWSKVPAIAEQRAKLLADIDQALQKLNSLPPAWFAGENENAIV